ncbi:MAG: (Fe-S)-binding protein, partial [Bacteroidota bacterium]
MDPSSMSIFGIPGYIILWAATLVSLACFGRRIVLLARLLKQARPENRFTHIGKRVRYVLTFVFGQNRLLNEPLIGAAHVVIFWGFVLFAATFAWNQLRWLFPFVSIPYADEVGVVRMLLEAFAILILVAITIATARRLFFPPPHLQKSGDANFILALIGSLMCTFLLGMEFRIGAGGFEEASLNPFDRLLARNGLGLYTSSTSAWQLYSWMFFAHQTIVLFFLAYLPHSKHMHLLASPFSVFFGNVNPAGSLDVSGSDSETSAGASRWDEFTWRQLFNSFACAECGRCDRACPALNSGYKLSPRMIVHHLKEHLLEAGLRSKGDKASGGHGSRPLIGEIVSEAELWACTTCYACMERCPVLNEHIPLIVSM